MASVRRAGAQANVLASLVSAEAAEEYDRLLSVGRVPVGQQQDEFDLNDPAGRELFEAGVLSFSGDGSFVRAAPPVVALRLVLNRQHRRLLELQDGVSQGWGRFARLTFSNTDLSSLAEEDDEVRALYEPTEIALLAAGLCRTSVSILRCTVTRGDSPQGMDEALLRTIADTNAVELEFRILHEEMHATTSSNHSHTGRFAMLPSEQSRLYHTVPLRMVHVDDTVALMITSRGALLITSKEILAMLGQWFDQLWEAAGHEAVNQVAASEFSPMRRMVLSLLVFGLTDEMIARRTGTSIRTVRRHVKEILDALDVDTRFAAGAAAAKRGWV